MFFLTSFGLFFLTKVFFRRNDTGLMTLFFICDFNGTNFVVSPTEVSHIIYHIWIQHFLICCCLFFFHFASKFYTRSTFRTSDLTYCMSWWQSRITVEALLVPLSKLLTDRTISLVMILFWIAYFVLYLQCVYTEISLRTLFMISYFAIFSTKLLIQWTGLVSISKFNYCHGLLLDVLIRLSIVTWSFYSLVPSIYWFVY